jgi:hypothetical protein
MGYAAGDTFAGKHNEGEHRLVIIIWDVGKGNEKNSDDDELSASTTTGAIAAAIAANPSSAGVVVVVVVVPVIGEQKYRLIPCVLGVSFIGGRSIMNLLLSNSWCN